VSELTVGAEDVFSPENRDNPWPLYRLLREQSPRYQDPQWGEWILTQHADCEAILRDPRWSSNPAHRTNPPDVEDVGANIREELAGEFNVLLFMDPPDHTRLRGLVSKAFTPRTVEQLRPHIQELVEELLDVAAERSRDEGSVDLLSELAYPLPVTVICEMMGVPTDDRALFGEWSSAASRLLDGDMAEEHIDEGMFGAMALINYFNTLIEERRAEPADDLLSALIAAEESGDKLTETELRSITLLLFIAGHETTMNLIGNGTKALLENRDQWERLVADPSLAASSVEELLRFDGPVHLTGRVATEDIEVRGHQFEKGEQVVTLVAAANRDPERYDDPDSLDIGRADNHHLTFSQGIHYCLGAALARVEGQVAISALAERFPDMQLATDHLEYRDHFVLRGLKELPVNLGS
jgi:cytochrome P450